ncbi:hypothetical protein RHSIM_Rhsim01G0260000 [Rhododendron simsii]|uniref:Uncharacterized protein n=1 Tax=Rhododendron simsii TaxID=118357 RepID=A0A834HRW9_RHOSS|nr:hypothetical protein RHSIM_Rhsim01G0260000 [Rhododendron simsii]
MLRQNSTMKNSGLRKQEEETATTDLLKSIDHLMSKLGGNQSFERINLGGKNVGAAMTVRRGCCGKSANSCNINIYINNNVQGVNNSLLLGSEVRMGDPGVCLSMRGVETVKGFAEANKKRKGFRLGFIGMFSLVVVSVLLLLSLLEVSPFSQRSGKFAPQSFLIPC